MYHDHPSEALDVIARLENKGHDKEHEVVQVKYRQIESNVAYEKSVQVKGFREMFRNDGLSTRRRLAIACSVQFFQQLGGINGGLHTWQNLTQELSH